MSSSKAVLDNLFDGDDSSRRLDAAAQWLLRSIEACPVQGSAAFYSRFYRPSHGWGNPYPETTGYIVPTFLKYGQRSHRPEFISLALEMAQWIMSLQHEDGSLPGGFGGKPHKPSVFNTGQMIFGLLSAYRVSSEKSFLSAASRAAQWLASVQEDDGSWTRYGYHPGFSPSYYSRVAWPMLMVWRLTGEDSLRLKAEKSLVLIAGRRHDRLKSIRDWGFHPGNAAFTHTIAYTIRGLLESSRLLEGGRKYWEIGEQAAMLIFRRFELKNQLAGRFSDDMKGDYRFTCLTGNCQMALCWTLLAARNGDARLLNAAIKAVSLVAKKQRLHTRDKNLRGAIPGSAPIWGRYLTLRYPNWAAKFYMDTLMEIEDLLNPQPLAREHQ